MKIEAAVGGTWLAGGMRFEKTIWFFAQRRHGSFRFFCILLFKSQYLRLQREASEASLRSRQVEQHNATREQAGVKDSNRGEQKMAEVMSERVETWKPHSADTISRCYLLQQNPTTIKRRWVGLGWARDGWLVMVAGRLSRQNIYIYIYIYYI